jgi:hypothetical protein
VIGLLPRDLAIAQPTNRKKEKKKEEGFHVYK